ncbi:hypothetical protein [Corynebacterium jeddahense]|uniref:hypothetical protein n=1 Tax=Corynebacterium jeddahense TaxID=1414719 RepID=UPI0012EED531|nr:hypothetical protein [Corynebacterium jeddahense]
MGLAAGASWGVLRPAYTGEAADGGVRIDTDASPANVAFTGYAWFAVLTAAVGVVIAAVAWRAVQRGRVRGGVGWMLLAVFAAAAAAAAAYICGGFVVAALHPMPDVTQLQPGDTVTLVPPVEPGVGWVAGPFAAAVVYWCTNLVALQGQPQR